MNVNPGELELLGSVRIAGSVVAVAYTDDGSFHILSEDGFIRSHDRRGNFTGEVDSGLPVDGFDATAEGWQGLVAFGTTNGVVLFEPATREVTNLPTLQGAVASLEFAQNGALLVIGGADGTIRTWDIEEGVLRGVIWRGSTSLTLGTLYDEETDSLWMTEPQRLILLPLNPEVFVNRACDVVNRDLTQDEWDRFVPGDEPLQSACP